MRIEILPNFITSEEASILNNFVVDAINGGQFKNGLASFNLNGPNKHLVSRFNKEIEFPKVALDLKNKLMQMLDLKETDTHNVYNDSGIVVNCTFNGGQVWSHKDAPEPNKALLRCNLLSNAPEDGGVLIVDGSPVELDELSMYFCLVSKHEHSVTPVKGNKPRVLWQFGFNVNENDWENRKIGYGISRN